MKYHEYYQPYANKYMEQAQLDYIGGSSYIKVNTNWNGFLSWYSYFTNNETTRFEAIKECLKKAYKIYFSNAPQSFVLHVDKNYFILFDTENPNNLKTRTY